MNRNALIVYDKIIEQQWSMFFESLNPRIKLNGDLAKQLEQERVIYRTSADFTYTFPVIIDAYCYQLYKGTFAFGTVGSPYHSSIDYALDYIFEYGDIPIVKTLIDNEIIELLKLPYHKHDYFQGNTAKLTVSYTYDSLLKLDIPKDVQSSLLMLKKGNKLIIEKIFKYDRIPKNISFLDLTPKGIATILILSRPYKNIDKSKVLKLPISKFYKIGQPGSYENVFWNYYYRFIKDGIQYEQDHEVWSKKYFFKRFNMQFYKYKKEHLKTIPDIYWNSFKPSLLESGFNENLLERLENRFSSIFENNFNERREMFVNNKLFVAATAFQHENPELYKHLLEVAKFLLKPILCSKPQPMIFKRSIINFRESIHNDLLLMLVVYNHIYAKLSFIDLLNYKIEKRGRPELTEKKAAKKIIVDLIDEFKRIRQKFKYDKAANLLNLLANKQIYDLKDDLTSSRNAQTKGGRRVYDEYRDLKKIQSNYPFN